MSPRESSEKCYCEHSSTCLLVVLPLILLGYMPRCGIAGWECKAKCLLKVIYIPISNAREFWLLHIPRHYTCCRSFNVLSLVEIQCLVVLIFIILITSNFSYPYLLFVHSVLWPSSSSLIFWKLDCQSFYYIF